MDRKTFKASINIKTSDIKTISSIYLFITLMHLTFSRIYRSKFYHLRLFERIYFYFDQVRLNFGLFVTWWKSKMVDSRWRIQDGVQFGMMTQFPRHMASSLHVTTWPTLFLWRTISPQSFKARVLISLKLPEKQKNSRT